MVQELVLIVVATLLYLPVAIFEPKLPLSYEILLLEPLGDVLFLLDHLADSGRHGEIMGQVEVTRLEVELQSDMLLLLPFEMQCDVVCVREDLIFSDCSLVFVLPMEQSCFGGSMP